MKKVLLMALSLIMIFSLAACSSSSSTETETRAADDKSWPTKNDTSLMTDVPEYSDEADLVTIEKTIISQNADKEVTYSEIVYIEYKTATTAEIDAYVTALLEEGFIADDSSAAYWASIAGSDATAEEDYSKPFVEITYDKDAEYNLVIKICWL